MADSETQSRSPPEIRTAELLARAARGDTRALSSLFRRHLSPLTRWARGRLPRWARSVNDTADIVQDVLLQTFRRVDRFEDRGRGALRGYLQAAIKNRINDEIRRSVRRPTSELGRHNYRLAASDPSPFETVAEIELQEAYRRVLATLSDDEQALVVGRLELDYNYDQLALISGRATPEAARIAVRRAVRKLAQRMAGA